MSTRQQVFAWVVVASLVLVVGGCTSTVKTCCPQDDGWISLFDGTSLDGWRASENKGSFSVRNGLIVANGKRSHLFYEGPVENHDFKNFELKVDVMTRKGSNGGIYFHTEYQETGWPDKGYEVQVNNTHKDWKKTGSLYSIDNVRDALVRDDVWFTEHIIVRGKEITVRVNGKTVVDYTEPDEAGRPDKMKGRMLSSGTIALQGHDPGSTVYYKNILIKPLP